MIRRSVFHIEQITRHFVHYQPSRSVKFLKRDWKLNLFTALIVFTFRAFAKIFAFQLTKGYSGVVKMMFELQATRKCSYISRSRQIWRQRYLQVDILVEEKTFATFFKKLYEMMLFIQKSSPIMKKTWIIIPRCQIAKEIWCLKASFTL